MSKVFNFRKGKLVLDDNFELYVLLKKLFEAEAEKTASACMSMASTQDFYSFMFNGGNNAVIEAINEAKKNIALNIVPEHVNIRYFSFGDQYKISTFYGTTYRKIAVKIGEWKQLKEQLDTERAQKVAMLKSAENDHWRVMHELETKMEEYKDLEAESKHESRIRGLKVQQQSGFFDKAAEMFLQTTSDSFGFSEQSKIQREMENVKSQLRSGQKEMENEGQECTKAYNAYLAVEDKINEFTNSKKQEMDALYAQSVNEIRREIVNAVLGLFPLCWQILEDKKIVSSENMPFLDVKKRKEADRIVREEMLKMSSDKVNELFPSIILESPYNPDLYGKALILLQDPDNELYQIAEYFGVHGLDKKKEDILKSRFQNIYLSFKDSLEKAAEARSNFVILCKSYGYSAEKSNNFINTLLAPHMEADFYQIFNSMRPSIRSSVEKASVQRNLFIKWAQLFGLSQDEAEILFNKYINTVKSEDVTAIFRELKPALFDSEASYQNTAQNFLSRSQIYIPYEKTRIAELDKFMQGELENETKLLFTNLRPKFIISPQEAKQAYQKFVLQTGLHCKICGKNAEDVLKEFLREAKIEDLRKFLVNSSPKFQSSLKLADEAKNSFIEISKIYGNTQQESEELLKQFLKDTKGEILYKLFEDLIPQFKSSLQAADEAKNKFMEVSQVYGNTQQETRHLFEERIIRIRKQTLKEIFIDMRPNIRSSAEKAVILRSQFIKWGQILGLLKSIAEEDFKSRILEVKDKDIAAILDELKPVLFESEASFHNAADDFLSRSQIYIPDEKERLEVLDKFMQSKLEEEIKSLLEQLKPKFTASPQSAKEAKQEFISQAGTHCKICGKNAEDILNNFLNEGKGESLEKLFEDIAKKFKISEAAAIEARKEFIEISMEYGNNQQESEQLFLSLLKHWHERVMYTVWFGVPFFVALSAAAFYFDFKITAIIPIVLAVMLIIGNQTEKSDLKKGLNNLGIDAAIFKDMKNSEIPAVSEVNEKKTSLPEPEAKKTKSNILQTF